MKTARAQVRFVTPCILAGTDQHKAELRAASIRGQLRWWFRLMNPDCREREKSIFGGVHGGACRSAVVVRVHNDSPLDTIESQKAEDIAGSNYDYFLWPLGRRGSEGRGVIKPEQSFTLMISHRQGQDNNSLPLDVLKAFLLAGSLGTRSRRAYGSIYPENLIVDGEQHRIPADLPAFSEEMQRILKPANVVLLQISEGQDSFAKAIKKHAAFLKSFRCGSEKSGTPSKWGRNDHDSPFSEDREVYRQVLGLPLEQRYSDNNLRVASSAVDCQRWASPLLLKVIPQERLFLPVAFFCNSMAMEGSKILLKGGSIAKDKDLSHDLWEVMQHPDDPEHKSCWKESERIF